MFEGSRSLVQSLSSDTAVDTGTIGNRYIYDQRHFNRRERLSELIVAYGGSLVVAGSFSAGSAICVLFAVKLK